MPCGNHINPPADHLFYCNYSDYVDRRYHCWHIKIIWRWQKIGAIRVARSVHFSNCFAHVLYRMYIHEQQRESLFVDDPSVYNWRHNLTYRFFASAIASDGGVNKTVSN